MQVWTICDVMIKAPQRKVLNNFSHSGKTKDGQDIYVVAICRQYDEPLQDTRDRNEDVSEREVTSLPSVGGRPDFRLMRTPHSHCSGRERHPPEKWRRAVGVQGQGPPSVAANNNFKEHGEEKGRSHNNHKALGRDASSIDPWLCCRLYISMKRYH